MKNTPSISVVIPAYNVERYLARALQSAIEQTQPPREVIVVDDGSTDRTAEVARRFGDQIRYIRQEHTGVSAARNRGIAEATGEWIAFLDSDDWWVPQRLQWAVEILQRHPELRWVSGRFHTALPDRPLIPHPETKAYLSELADGCYFPDFFAASALGVRMNTDTMFIHRSVLGQVDLFDPRLRRGQDLDVWYRIADYYPSIGYINEPIAVYEHTGESALVRYRDVVLTDYLTMLSKHISAECPPDWETAGSRDRFFRGRIAWALKYAVKRGEKKTISHILRTYRGWLLPRTRLWGRAASLLPGPFLALMSGCYSRLAALLRSAMGRCA